MANEDNRLVDCEHKILELAGTIEKLLRRVVVLERCNEARENYEIEQSEYPK